MIRERRERKLRQAQKIRDRHLLERESISDDGSHQLWLIEWLEPDRHGKMTFPFAVQDNRGNIYRTCKKRGTCDDAYQKLIRDFARNR